MVSGSEWSGSEYSDAESLGMSLHISDDDDDVCVFHSYLSVVYIFNDVFVNRNEPTNKCSITIAFE